MQSKSQIACALLLSIHLVADGRAQSEVKLGATPSQLGAEFGISCETTGDVTVVGARFHDQAAVDAGAAFVFARSGSRRDSLMFS